MSASDSTTHSALIVSTSEPFNSLVEKSLRGFITVEYRKSAAAARQYLVERYYDLVLINAPLPDENGEELALDVTEQGSASVLLVVPRDSYEEVMERVTDYGVMVLPRPSPKGQIRKGIRFLTADQDRIHRLERKLVKAQEKLEEQRLVTRAKFLLVEKKKMSEDEAHRFIGKLAMDNGISRGAAARRLLEDAT
ncbi:MAG: ANTAR domain-containing protein [Lachnospiraceae bacterium]|nr:ANTAR domain-containing protein [Lachnospiraceae bacterium]